MFTNVIQITSNEFSIHQMWRCGGNLQILLQFCNQWTVWNFFYIVKRSHGLISRQDFDRKRKHWMFTYVNSILCLLTLPASNNGVKHFWSCIQMLLYFQNIKQYKSPLIIQWSQMKVLYQLHSLQWHLNYCISLTLFLPACVT